MTRATAVTFLIVMLAVFSPVLAADCPDAHSEGWDTGTTNGWVGFAGTTVTVSAAGGNPGGYLRGENVGQVGIVTSDAAWTGAWGSDLRELAFDVQAFGSGDGVAAPYVRVRRDATTNGWYYFFGGQVPIDGQWHTLVAPINPTWTDQEATAHGWVLIPSTTDWSWADTMANVGYLVVATDSGASVDEWVGFDNVERSCRLFADGFESGTTDAWSVAVPASALRLESVFR